MKAETVSRRAALEIASLGARQEVQNRLSPSNLQARIIERLPEMMEKMPKPAELRSVTIGGSGASDGQSVAGVVAQIVAVVNALQGTDKSAAPKG